MDTPIATPTPTELATLATELVNAAEGSAREHVAARIAGILNEAHQNRTRSPEADQLEHLKAIVHAANDDLFTVQALLSAVRALAVDREDNDTQRLVDIVGNKVECVVNVLADYV
jgi:hypothetical protein